MNVTYEHRPAMTFIGFSTSIRPEEGYQKCPEFWDKEYSQKYARLWQTMQPETPVEQAILENGIGMFAICDEKEGSFEYWIAGLYKGGQVPEGLNPGKRLGDVLGERCFAKITSRSEYPGLAGVVSEGGAEIHGQRKRHAGGLLSRRYAKPGLRVRHLGADLRRVMIP